MTNNECRLIGWLEIETVEAEILDGHQAPIIQGYISTQDATYGNRHPVTIKGKVADVVLNWARQIRGHPPRVMLRGKLHSKNGNTKIVGQYIQFLDMYIDYNLLAQKLQKAMEDGEYDLQETLANILMEYGICNTGSIDIEKDDVEESTNDTIA